MARTSEASYDSGISVKAGEQIQSRVLAQLGRESALTKLACGEAICAFV